MLYYDGIDVSEDTDVNKKNVFREYLCLKSILFITIAI